MLSFYVTPNVGFKTVFTFCKPPQKKNSPLEVWIPIEGCEFIMAWQNEKKKNMHNPFFWGSGGISNELFTCSRLKLTIKTILKGKKTDCMLKTKFFKIGPETTAG